ncbi:MAG: putative Fatty acid synthase subunit beta [Subtercola sp.]|nr:putative Fatty acid synthase subunit beta [Subtercola sp.]
MNVEDKSVEPAIAPVLGTRAETRTFGPMTPEMFVVYSGAAGDLNPMHYDRDFAQRAGYPSIFAQGMLSAALLSTFATDWLGPNNIRRFHVRFRDIVWPGDELTCSGEVTKTQRHADGTLVSISLSMMRQTGDTALQGEADFLVPQAY